MPAHSQCFRVSLILGLSSIATNALGTRISRDVVSGIWLHIQLKVTVPFRNSTREVTCAVTIVKVYRRPYPHDGNTSSCSRTLIFWKQSLEPRPVDLALRRLAPRDGFEPPAKRLTVACSTAELPGKRLRRFIHHKSCDAIKFFEVLLSFPRLLFAALNAGPLGGISASCKVGWKVLLSHPRQAYSR